MKRIPQGISKCRIYRQHYHIYEKGDYGYERFDDKGVCRYGMCFRGRACNWRSAWRVGRGKDE